ncbi:cupin domain-containing protein [Microbacterium sp. NPDC056234]|uniref:cupin domain-containing protein n=1 Tax=Microbacterium sp. NPDC056234 TaxID=3345757 RepID=UPI0035E1FCA4
MTSSFPGGTSLSDLEVYTDAAPDGVCGGSPHMHLASTEAYIVTAGRGELHTIDADGYRETPLSPGSVVWFTPGTVHRAVNLDGLRVIVLMSNAGLPEAGDAVLTFPADVVGDADSYADAVSLGEPQGRDVRAARRRDLAVAGFEALRDSVLAGDRGPVDAFHAAAAALVRSRAQSWPALVSEGPLAQARRAMTMAQDLADGSWSHLGDARVRTGEPAPGAPAFGMCGRLRTYDFSTDNDDQQENQK